MQFPGALQHWVAAERLGRQKDRYGFEDLLAEHQTNLTPDERGLLEAQYYVGAAQWQQAFEVLQTQNPALPNWQLWLASRAVQADPYPSLGLQWLNQRLRQKPHPLAVSTKCMVRARQNLLRDAQEVLQAHGRNPEAFPDGLYAQLKAWLKAREQ